MIITHFYKCYYITITIITKLLLPIIMVIMESLLPITSRSTMGNKITNNGFMITYYWHGQFRDADLESSWRCLGALGDLEMLRFFLCLFLCLLAGALSFQARSFFWSVQEYVCSIVAEAVDPSCYTLTFHTFLKPFESLESWELDEDSHSFSQVSHKLARGSS